MRRARLVVLVAVAAALLAACTPRAAVTTGTSEPPTSAPLGEAAPGTEELQVALIWHQHQPRYPKDDSGVVTRPWVRVHATKDYLDMAALVEEFPDLRVTFNLTPVLMLQLEELTRGTKDSYWTSTEVHADLLEEDQKLFLLHRFFDVNPRVVGRFPRFQELADRRTEAGGAAGAVDAFSEPDYRDLQVLFNLAWTDPSFLARPPLRELVDRGRDFTEEDKRVVLAEHARIVAQVLPLHARLWEEGAIELTTTPYAHPILPLLVDTDLALEGDPGALLPKRPFREVADATAQVQGGLAVAERLLGRRPVGMWPAEGAVAQEALALFSREGVQWVATGEDVLAPSLGIGSFTRSGDDTVQEADLLYRPWRAEFRRNPEIALLFRDRVLSDLIGFQYSGMDGETAADDLMRRLQAIRSRLAELDGEEGHLVTIVVDGENAWEHYENDGQDFLRALYRRLTSTEGIRTVTPSEYLAAHGDLESLEHVFPGSWLQPSFANWIGEEEEARAWEYLFETRQALGEVQERGEVHPDVLAEGFDAMYLAEGSDWFWWYGDDQDSGDDTYFDQAFRQLLGRVYDAIGQDRPPFLSVPIVGAAPIEGERAPEGQVTIRVDNRISPAEWSAAGLYRADGGSVEGFWYGFDEENLYIRVDFAEAVLGRGQVAFDIYLGVPGAGDERPTSVRGTLLGLGATHLVRWSGTDPLQACLAVVLPPLGIDEPPAACAPITTGFDGRSVEVALPIDAIGSPSIGDRVLFRVVGSDLVRDVDLLPSGAAGLIQVPDLSEVSVFLEVDDPEGDDHGVGR